MRLKEQKMMRWRDFILIVLIDTCRSFVCNTPLATNQRSCLLSSTSLGLVPIGNFCNDVTFLDGSDSDRCCFDREGRLDVGIGDGDDNEEYQLCVVQKEDLPDVARFVVNAFGADVISLSKDLSSLEKALLQPPARIFNAYSGLVAYVEVLSGLQSRTKDRIDEADLAPPKLSGKDREEKLKQAARSSLVLAVARKSADSDWHIDVIASVELRLEPCDAKIPFSFPWLDRMERKIAKSAGLKGTTRDLQPYLSNLCVDEKYRRRKLGKAIVRCVEDIAQSWGYSRLYLHVDLDNEAALKLYQNEGYKDVGKRWKPFWAGKAADIGYFCKKLDKKQTRQRDDDRQQQTDKNDKERPLKNAIALFLTLLVNIVDY